MVELNLKHIYKHYDNAEDGQYSVTDFNLDIKDREFIVLSDRQAAANQRPCA